MAAVKPMTPMPNAPGHRGVVSCEGCLFYLERAGVLEKIGECRRYPPVLLPNPRHIGGPTHHAPNVTPRHWCGEFTPREPAPKPRPRPLPARLWHRLMLLLDPFPKRF